MRRRVTLHIGLHKTGTTTFQHTLAYNTKALERHRFRYVSAGRDLPEYHTIAPPHHELAIEIRKGEPSSLERLTWAEAHREIGSTDADRFLLSSEMFALFEEEQLARLARELAPFDVRVVVVLRNLADRIQSSYREVVKRGETRTFDRFLEDTIERSPIGYRHHDLLERWSRAFGADSLEVLCYEEIREDIVGRLLDACGMGAAAPDLTYERSENVNPSPGVHSAEILRAAGGILFEGIGEGAERHALVAAIQAAVSEEPGPGGDLMTDAQATRLLDAFREQTRRVHQDHRPLPGCYFTPRPMRPVAPDPTPEHAIRFLARAWRHYVGRGG
jgi:hypothetical protein